MSGDAITAPAELVAFAFVEEDYIASNGDVSVGLMRLFAPLLAGSPNKIFDHKEFSAQVEARFDIPMSPLAAEGLIEKMAQAELLYLESEDSQVFRISPNKQTPTIDDTNDVDLLMKEYVGFAKSSLEKSGSAVSDAEISESFFRHIVTLDFLSFLDRPDKDYFRGNTIRLQDDADDEEADIDHSADHLLQVVCAEFVLDLMERNPERFATLEKIVSGVLIADVVLTLKEPAGLDEFDSVDIALDSPLVLDLLQLSSPERQDYAEDLISLVAKTGARKIIFLHVLDEIRGAIKAPLDALRQGRDPFGPLGSRLRRESGMLPYAQAILDDLDEQVASLGITVIDAAEYDTDELRKYCPDDLFDSIRNNLGPIYTDIERRIRDAKSVAATLKMRAPLEHWESLGSAQSVFVTRNNAVAKKSTSTLLGRHRINASDFPPAITDRQLAGLLWLVCGGDVGKLSRKRLVANCATVMSPRRDILSKMRQVLSEGDPKKTELFAALMTDQRAQRCFVHRTLGLPAAITPESADGILEDVRRSTAEEIRQEAAQLIEKLKTQSAEEAAATKNAHEELVKERDKKVESLENRAKSLNEKLETKGQKIDSLTEDVINLQQAHLLDINTRIQRAVRIAATRERIAKYSIIIAFAVLVGFLGYLTENRQVLQQFGVSEAMAKNLVVGGGVVVALVGFWFLPHVIFDGLLRRVWRNSLHRKAAEFAVSEQLTRCDIDEDERSVSECRLAMPERPE